jgi:hypothetical protein
VGKEVSLLARGNLLHHLEDGVLQDLESCIPGLGAKDWECGKIERYFFREPVHNIASKNV